MNIIKGYSKSVAEYLCEDEQTVDMLEVLHLNDKEKDLDKVKHFTKSPTC